MFREHDVSMLNRQLFCLVCIVLCGGLVFLFLSQQAVSAEIIYSDTFTRQELDSWQVVQNFQWQNESLPCMNQAQPAAWRIMLEQLGITIFGPGCFTEIIPTDFFLPLNTSYSYSFDIMMPSNVSQDRNYTIRYLDPKNAVAFKILDDQIYLEKAANGIGWSVPGSRTTYVFRPDRTYRIRNEIRTDHSIKVYIDDELVLDFYDQEPFLDGGTVGFRASVGSIPQSEVWFDNVVVEELPNVQLDLPSFSQRDPAWRSEPYDHANHWHAEDPSIERWGCALVSAAMILKFHGIQTLPSGELLTPSSLNQWLQSQQDGYIGQGLVNWISLTRLVREYRISHPHQYNLEYRRSNADDLLMQTSIHEGRPFIGQLSNHFVAAKGIKEVSPLKLSIVDPYSPDQTEIDAANIGSIREFVPSYTDLRYILLVAPEQVQITAEHAQEIYYSEVQTADSHPDLEETYTSSQVLEIPKPLDGKYRITFRSNQIQEHTIQTFLYDEDARAEMTEITVPTSPQGTVFTLTFASGASSTLQIRTVESLVSILDAYWELGAFDPKSQYLELRFIAEEIVRRIETNNMSTFDRAIKLFIQKIQESEIQNDLLWPLLDSDQ